MKIFKSWNFWIGLILISNVTGLFRTTMLGFDWWWHIVEVTLGVVVVIHEVWLVQQTK